MKRIQLIYLDILTLPTHILNNKSNAKYHLKYVCPKCPQYRRQLRDVEGKNECWWYTNWSQKKCDIPRHFGVINWIMQYLFLKTNLDKFKKYT
jgi:hypothetical protein